MPTVPAPIFRAYDIRGLVATELTPAVAETIGRAYATYLQRVYGSRAVVVGRDNRPSSLDLRDALVRGLCASGTDVVDIGLAPSPLLYYAAAAGGVVGGVNVTASHLPAEYNGLKLLERGGIPLSPEEIQDVRRLAEAGDFTTGAGTVRTRDPRPAYLDLLAERFRLPRPLKVVVDPGNAVGALTGPEALRRIGCAVIGINTELDGTFPAHLPDPAEIATLAQLQAAVREHRADLGIAWDGDADRVGIVTEEGTALIADQVFPLLARDYLARHPGAAVQVDVKMSLTTLDDIRAHGGVPVFSRTGHSLAKRHMRVHGIGLGGEGSGHFFFGEDYYGLDDGVYAACALARILAASDQPVSAHIATLRRYITSPEIKLAVEDAAKFDAAARIAARLKAQYPVLDLDGARVDFGDGWALVRASNTGAFLTVRIEAETPEAYARARAIMLDAIAAEPTVTVPEGVGAVPS